VSKVNEVTMTRTTRLAWLAWLISFSAATAGAQGTPPAPESTPAKVDAIFSRWDSTFTPGCAVGVSQRGSILFEKGYGMADLEHDAVIRSATMFEAGSISKQFTAAAVLLLARDGRLSLEDSVRKHFPELPEVTAPVTIRQMLQHTSGLRDWGDIAMLGGWPRTTRTYRHADVLDILSRQTALNFAPGTDWSYSNSGYNLAAMLVARVSGRSFAEFTKARLFEPLGLRDTSWRDDFTRVVPGRAIAYDEDEGRFSMLMPFERVHGNGGLLTTVGDLLRWNEHLQAAKKGDNSLLSELQVPGTLANGRSHGYAFGLNVGKYRGVSEVSHGGATAGYRAFLTRFPNQHLSVALLCNAAPVNAEELAHRVAEVFLGSALGPEPRIAAIPLPEGEAGNLTGTFRGAKRGDMITVVREKEGLRVERGAPLVPTAPGRFAYGRSTADVFPESGMPVTRIRVLASNGTEDVYERVGRATPLAAQLTPLVGVYRAPDVEVDLQVVFEDGTLRITSRPDRVVSLRPLYADAFDSSVGLVRFVRDSRGEVTHMSIGTSRAWDVRFARLSGAPATAAGR
jgi:CubicO group peptidase (beta-lactamase class C family)